VRVSELACPLKPIAPSIEDRLVDDDAVLYIHSYLPGAAELEKNRKNRKIPVGPNCHMIGGRFCDCHYLRKLDLRKASSDLRIRKGLSISEMRR
jgi:hypothetical protein